VIPLSGRVPGRASGPSRSRVDDDSGLQYVLWKIDRVLRVFPSRGIYRWKGGITWWRGQGLACTTPWCGRPIVPLRLSIGLHLILGKIGTLAFVLSNSENISCVTFLKQKNSRKQGTGTMTSR
jgi:hypothetical protein